jgi:hypothetical protein
LWGKHIDFYNTEDEGLKKIRKSAITDQIHEADKARDEITDIIEAHILLGTDSKAVLEPIITAFNWAIERYIRCRWLLFRCGCLGY